MTDSSLDKVLEGFLLTGDWEDVKGRCYLRFFGKSQDGPFEVIVTKYQPGFFVQKLQTKNPLPFDCHREDAALRSFEGQALDRLSFPNYHAASLAKKHLRSQGGITYESDLKPPETFLMDRGIFAQVRLTNPQHIRKREGLVQWIDPEMEPLSSGHEDVSGGLCLLSFDIETGKKGQLFSIAIHCHSSKGDDYRTVLLLKPSGTVVSRNGTKVRCIPREDELLDAFIEEVARLDPDILMGWNVVGFDLDFILKKMKSYGIQPKLGRNNSLLRLYKGGMGLSAATLGRVVIDVPRALRLNFFQFESFGLEAVAREVLGEGKLITSGQGKWEEIERQYFQEPEALVDYNIQDAVLVTRIVEKTGIIDLLQKRSMISGMLLARVGGSTAAFDHQMIPAIHQAGFAVAELGDVNYQSSAKGGHVFVPVVGLHKHVVVLDFRSLYPSIIKTFHIDPLALLMAEESPRKTPVGIAFSSTHHALPDIITKLLDERHKAKARNDKHLAQAIKILMNSFYGVMGSSGCRFYHEALPTAITGTGRFLLEKTKEYLEDRGYSVIYGDTDSVFVSLKAGEEIAYAESGERIAKSLNEFFKVYLRDHYDVESYLDMEYEKYYRDFFLPPSRSEAAGEGDYRKGSKKRYVGIMCSSDGGEDELVFTGMEYVRSDWTRLAKNFQWQLYTRLFAGEPVEEWMTGFLADLKKGLFDGDLVYKKRLTKPPHEYTKTKPPHVRAALQLLAKDPGASKRYIRYLMTVNGPVPEAMCEDDLDYDHYIHKQLKPIADAVLPFFYMSFDEVGSQGWAQPMLF